ncbi:hypothetical protein WN55_10623 [Dufourea novaeangliae]|uniref:Secreted protein n=1 Tax=Dufourea novaeangliae TaxID=178035 RepID=A0A154P431_DUFNO|nr:hypothetical protein WN55_10623 [Dufourea novaeangliae]
MHDRRRFFWLRYFVNQLMFSFARGFTRSPGISSSPCRRWTPCVGISSLIGDKTWLRWNRVPPFLPQPIRSTTIRKEKTKRKEKDRATRHSESRFFDDDDNPDTLDVA